MRRRGLEDLHLTGEVTDTGATGEQILCLHTLCTDVTFRITPWLHVK